jgi:hypothetical protein
VSYHTNLRYICISLEVVEVFNSERGNAPNDKSEDNLERQRCHPRMWMDRISYYSYDRTHTSSRRCRKDEASDDRVD